MPLILPSDVLEGCDGLIRCWASWAYDVTGGFFWVGMLLAFCIVILIATIGFGTNRSFGFASTVGLLGSIWLATAGLMAWWITSMFILAGVVGLAMMILSDR